MACFKHSLAHDNSSNMAWLKHIPVCMKCALTLKSVVIKCEWHIISLLELIVEHFENEYDNVVLLYMLLHIFYQLEHFR